MAIVAGFGPLYAFVGAEEGVALKVSGKYLTPVDNKKKKYHIECWKNTKDPRCKFLLEKVNDDKVYKVRMKDFRGVYLCQTPKEKIKFTETVKKTCDASYEFDVFTKGEVVLFRAKNGKYLNLNDKQIIEATKDGPDMSCEFSPTIGDIISPEFQIKSLYFKKTHEVVYKQSVEKKEIYINRSSQPQKHRFNMSWMKSDSETTTWNHAWGLNAKVSGKLIVADIEVSVSYSGSYGTSSTKQKTITMGDETEVTIPPNKKITVKSVVNKQEDCLIPFVATIRKIKSNGVVKEFTEEGIWEGVIYENMNIDIEEEEL